MSETVEAASSGEFGAGPRAIPARTLEGISSYQGGAVWLPMTLDIASNTICQVPSTDLRPPEETLLQAGLAVAHRYRLIELIGMGATASVWQAFDTQLEREVALKVFSVGDVTGAAASRVVREARACGAIVSDHVIRVHNACVDEALGVVAIDMELCREVGVDGTASLGRELATEVTGRHVRLGAKRKLGDAEIRETAKWVMDAARGVDAAHRQGIFHRDLKPANILLRPETRRAQVLDFGLAAQASANEMFPKGVRVLAGTPEYMAPEQAVGLVDLDPANNPLHRHLLARIDVYGLGAVLYELLALKPPHEQNEGEHILALLHRARENRIDKRALRRRGVPRALIDITLRALATDPEERYARPAELAADLDNFLTARPTLSEQRRPIRRLVLAARRNPRLTSTLVASCVLAAVVAVGAWQVRLAERAVMHNRQLAAAAQRDRTNAELARKEEEKRRSDAEAAKASAVEEADSERLKREQAEAARKLASEALEAQKSKAGEDRQKAALEKATATTEQARLKASIAELEAMLREADAVLKKEKLDHAADVESERKRGQSAVSALTSDHAKALDAERRTAATEKAAVESELKTAKSSITALETKVAQLEQDLKTARAAAASRPASNPNRNPGNIDDEPDDPAPVAEAPRGDDADPEPRPVKKKKKRVQRRK